MDANLWMLLERNHCKPTRIVFWVSFIEYVRWPPLQSKLIGFIAIYDRALSNGLLLASYDDLVKTLISRCDFERRTIDWSSGK